MLREEMGMEATRLIQTNRRHMLQKELFLRWVIKCVMPWRSKRRIADKHFLRSRGKYIFKLMRTNLLIKVKFLSSLNAKK